MPTPQAAIFVDTTLHHYHLEFDLIDDADLAEAVSLAREAVLPFTDLGGQVVIGARPSLWRHADSAGLPGDITDFATINGVEGFQAPSTQHDLWFWLHGPSLDGNLDAAMAIDRALQKLAQRRVDVRSFVRAENRDLTGFIDGSANPQGEAIYEAAILADGSPGAGGSIAFTQRWVHDLPAFHALSVAQQEAVIGRTRDDSIELEGDAMPADSHVSRTDVKIDGVAMKIYRRSTPYGTVGEHGLFFVAFACEQRRIQVQLERMYGTWTDDLHDRLVHFSRAVTGSYWFVPAVEQLDALGAG